MRHRWKSFWGALRSNPKRSTLIVLIAVLTTLVVIPALIAVKSSNEAVRRVGALAVCQSDWNQSFAEAYRVRLESSLVSSKNLDKIMQSVDDKDRSAFRKAVDGYVKARAEQVKDAVANPYPPLPDQFCGGEQAETVNP